MVAYLFLAALGVWCLFWPHVAKQMFIWPWSPPRHIFVRLTGLLVLSIVA